MNQRIIFNEDFVFDTEKLAWCFSGLVSGELITIFVAEKYYSRKQVITSEVQFDWEEVAEDWLEDNEPDENQCIWLVFE